MTPSEREARQMILGVCRTLMQHAVDPKSDIRTMTQQMRQTADLIDAAADDHSRRSEAAAVGAAAEGSD